MNIKLTNQNYNATVVEIKTLIPLENCDNVQVTLIMGNQVVKCKSTKFLEYETKQLDKMEIDIENEQ